MYNVRSVHDFMYMSVYLHCVQDPSDFQAAFDELVGYASSTENWTQIKDELTDRGVRTN